jgi:hypothetical protein
MLELFMASLIEPALLDESYHNSFPDILISSTTIHDSRYLNPRLNGSADHLSVDTIAEFLMYPGESFLANFRMKQQSFQDLVQLLEEKGGNEYWCQNPAGARGINGRPVCQQIAVALYILASQG